MLAAVIMVSLGLGEPPAPPPAQPPPAPSEPSLDDLLGIPKGTPKDPKAPPAEAPPDPSKGELNRQLSPQESQDDFETAVSLMDETAQHLQKSADAGIDTQRLQKQVLEKLDKLIDQARKQNSKSKSKSKSKQNSDSQSQNQKTQQSSQAANQQQSTNSVGENNVPMTQGKLNPPPGGSAAWGKLPERLRDALMQGRDDKYSSVWEVYTREYYKRLAEQPNRPGGTP